MIYKKRILIPCMVRVGTDRQLCQAQTFNERLDALLSEWETAEIYPLSAVETAVREQAIEAVSLMQHAICEGISQYEELGEAG